MVLCGIIRKEMNRDTEFFNKEAGQYSAKRYPDRSFDYVHFSFKKRKKILFRMIAEIVKQESRKEFSLLDVGCADGVITMDIRRNFSQVTSLTGIDISPEMITQAQKLNTHKEVTFYRREEAPLTQFDIIIEIGVVTSQNAVEELRSAYQQLHEGGYYVCAIASRVSLRSRFKVEKEELPKYLIVDEYERAAAEYFEITESEVYGLFIPYLWKLPIVARVVQPAVEFVAKYFLPSLFHEKIYLLKRRP